MHRGPPAHLTAAGEDAIKIAEILIARGWAPKRIFRALNSSFPESVAAVVREVERAKEERIDACRRSEERDIAEKAAARRAIAGIADMPAREASLRGLINVSTRAHNALWGMTVGGLLTEIQSGAIYRRPNVGRLTGKSLTEEMASLVKRLSSQQGQGDLK